MLSSIKVLVGKDNPRDYRGAGVKRTMVTAIECVSADGRSLFPMIIWPATTHQSNWTTYLLQVGIMRALNLDTRILRLA
jgi:hypothetical protein